MKYMSWSAEKNKLLKNERGISFEEMVYQIESGKLFGIEENPTHSNQKIFIIELNNYAYIVPFVENAQEIFLKTAFPSRKYSKRYGLGGNV